MSDSTTTNSQVCSMLNQIEYLAKIEKCALANPDLPIEFIEELLITKNLDRALAETFTPMITTDKFK